MKMLVEHKLRHEMAITDITSNFLNTSKEVLQLGESQVNQHMVGHTQDITQLTA